MQKNYKSPKVISLDKLGKKIPVQVRQSKRARHLSIKISSNKVELILPDNNFSKAYNFLLSKEDLIRKKLKSYKNIVRNNNIPIFGRDYKVSHINITEKKVQLHDDGNLVVFSSTAERQKDLQEFLISLIKLAIEPIVTNLCNKMDLQFLRIRISDTKSSGGSCSVKRILAFNW